MEADEIGVVLARASELHSKISDAIERASKSDNNAGDAEDTSHSSATAGDGSSEEQSLVAIQDALEVLEEQLESLQTVQQQQRTEKDGALAELEESRRSLLSRLKDHHGNEWEVVHEALAFAGEPVEEADDLRLPPYPMPPPDDSSGGDQDGQGTPKYNGALRDLSVGAGKSEGVENRSYAGEGDGSDEENQEAGTSFQGADGGREGGGLLGIAKALFGLTTKVGILAACIAAALAVGEVGQTFERRKSSSDAVSKTGPSPPPIATARQMPPAKDCPPGQKFVTENGHTKCVVKERVELPFREITIPDVLYGRG